MVENNYNIVMISTQHNEFFDIDTNRYRVDIQLYHTINDYYDIVNEIIELNKEENIDIRIKISMSDENNPRMDFETELRNILEITPDDLFDIVELIDEDDDDFYISNTTIFTVLKVRIPS